MGIMGSVRVAIALSMLVALAGASEKGPLRLVNTIPLPNVQGRLDHMDVDVKGQRLFIAGLENGSVEVVDLRARKWIRSIPGFNKPQGVAYIPALNKLYVTSGDDGMLRVFRGDTLAPLATIHLDLGPNRLIYDAHRKYVYVGYGGAEAGKDYGEIGVIDANADKKIALSKSRLIRRSCCWTNPGAGFLCLFPSRTRFRSSIRKSDKPSRRGR